jgi:hypothetical protein
MSRHLPLLVLLLAGVGASPLTAAECPPELRAQLAGTWEWVRAEGGFVGGVYGPADWGYTQQLVFTPAGTVIEYRDNLERARSTSDLDCADGEATLTSATADPPVMPLAECAPYAMLFGEEPGDATLVLRVQTCADLFDFTYVSRGPVANSATTWGAIKSAYR